MMDSRHRLQQARAQAGYASPSDAARALRDINKNTLISHENGNRPLSRKAAEKYGRLFNVDPGWLLFNADGSEAAPVSLAPSPVTVDVPIVSWISAGELGSQDSVVNLSDYPTIPTADLEEGEWIALRVDGDGRRDKADRRGLTAVGIEQEPAGVDVEQAAVFLRRLARQRPVAVLVADQRVLVDVAQRPRRIAGRGIAGLGARLLQSVPGIHHRTKCLKIVVQIVRFRLRIIRT